MNVAQRTCLNHAADDADSVVRMPDLSSALKLAGCDGAALIEVFVSDWAAVDAARAEVARRGFGGRIAVHHEAALAMLKRLRILPPGQAPACAAAVPLSSRLDGFIRAVAAVCGGRRCLTHTNGVSA